jgi:dihydrofolate synthase/folylpolyglutamate synthase
MTVNNEPISDEDFAEQLGLVDLAIKKSGVERMSFFEILTCMAYNYFCSCKVDIAIMETGIGGRLDATNIIDKPLLSVITAPGYDHQELLGETLGEITTEDAGIIKEGCPVAAYPNPEVSVISNIAKERNAALYYIGENAEIYDIEYRFEATYFSVNSPCFSYKALEIGLLGEHQLHNAVNVLLCIEALKRDRGIIISDEALRKGLSDCRWPGRFEPVSAKPVIILDGAHNEDGAVVFSKALRRYFSDKKIVLVLGISYHKDRDVILKNILTEADIVICTCSSFKATPAAELSAAAMGHTTVPVLTEPDCRKALAKAIELAGEEGKTIVAAAGSLYLVGELRQAVFCR